MRTGPDAPLAWGQESGEYLTSSPAVDGDTVVFGSGDGALYAVAIGTGRQYWRYQTGGRVRSSPAIAGGVVFAGSQDGSIYAVDLATGRLRWRYDTEGRSLESAHFGYDRKTIQIARGRQWHRHCRRARWIPLRWKRDYAISWVNSSAAVADGVVYTGTSDAAYVDALDLTTEHERWRFSTASIVWGSPTVAGGLVYVGEGTGALHAIDRRTGAERWRFTTGGFVLSSPVVAHGMLYVGSNDGSAYALRGDSIDLARAVFWDSSLARTATLPAPAAARQFFADRGYRVLDTAGLALFLRAGRGVVVLGVDPPAADSALLHAYLAGGGKIVCMGAPPLIWPADSAGNRSLLAIDRGAASRVLGLDLGRANWDLYTARVTAEGERWGLAGWWEAAWSVPADGVVPLAVNEAGLAAAWVRSYGGPPATGFVEINRGRNGRRPWTDSELPFVDAVAVFRPLAER